MEINCINHEANREVTQMAWAIFGNLEGKIISEKIDNLIKTTVIFKNQEYQDISKFFEKNDAKRSLLKCSKQIYDFDVPWGILTGINPAKLAFDNFDKKKFMEKYLVLDRQAELCKSVADFTKSIKVCKDDISVYIGIPFCRSKCKYCSFVSNSIDTANKYMEKYVDCLILEIEATAKLIKNRKLRAIYIGGGTPTALDEKNFYRVLLAVKENFDTKNLLEYTVEAGRVDTISDEKLQMMKDFFVDRISINPQVFDDEILKEIGRNHTVKQVVSVYEKARKLNFKAINMDIIYGLGGNFPQTVDKILELNPENITIHTLAIKKGSKIDKSYNADLGDINYFYERIFEKYKPYYMYKQQYMIKPYENVGFYRDDTPCIYNVYMMENLMDILAIGSGSTSKIAGESLFNNKYPLDYINNIDKILENKKRILDKE